MTFPDEHPFTWWFYLSSVPFTRAVLDKETSLGGSESACRVLAEGLAQRGHAVHCYATQLLPDLPDEAARAQYLADLAVRTGVSWHAAEQELAQHCAFETPDVFVSLRMPDVFALNIPAKLRVLWAQDLLQDDSFLGKLAAVDRIAFVSAYHREQWCTKHPMLRDLAWVVTNPIDPADLAAATKCGPKEPYRLIHISRPERGLDGILTLWPQIRERCPDATLRLCRYDSMYDAGGWGKICEQYDEKVRVTNIRYGGITSLGPLNKPQLYAELMEAAAMIYPTTQPNFAETNCVAATEAQACGTPIIASWKGALPETIAPGAGILIDGELKDPAVQIAWLTAITSVLRWHATGDEAYLAMQAAGDAHAPHAYQATVAAGWEASVRDFFEQRYAANRVAVLRQLLHWDNHAPARLVADELLEADDHVDEAAEAAALCARVITQEEQTADHYAEFAIQDPAAEARQNTRLEEAAAMILTAIADIPLPVVLDVACGNGAMALLLLRGNPRVRVLGIDYSPGVLALARKAVAAEGFADRATFEQAEWQSLTGFRSVPFDAVFCGEFLEHVEHPWALIDALEAVCTPNGRIVLTTPCGPFFELLDPSIPRHRGHVHAFALRDIAWLCHAKRHFVWRYAGIGVSPRGTPCGYWMLSFMPGGGPAGALDYTHTILTTRPYQRLAAMLIVRNEVGSLHRCLSSIQRIVDQIFVLDFGSTDGSVELARHFKAQVSFGLWPNHFAAARNAVLARAEREAEFVLWIDADEVLAGGVHLRRYVSDSGPYLAYVIKQCHLVLDGANFEDKPLRLFRTRRDIQFFGRVHEQPEFAPDVGITPSLLQEDVRIIHHGYETAEQRNDKLLHRNLPLLVETIRSGECRELDWVFYIRDLVNIAAFDMQASRGQLTVKAYQHLAKAVAEYHARFSDPTHKMHAVAWPYYQQALRFLGTGIDIHVGFLAARGELPAGRTPAGERVLVADVAEGRRLIHHRLETWFAQLTGPTIATAPVLDRATWLQTSAQEVAS